MRSAFGTALLGIRALEASQGGCLLSLWKAASALSRAMLSVLMRSVACLSFRSVERFFGRAFFTSGNAESFPQSDVALGWDRSLLLAGGFHNWGLRVSDVRACFYLFLDSDDDPPLWEIHQAIHV